MIVGVDASRNRSWGAICHMIGLLENFRPSSKSHVKHIHVWSHKSLIDKLPDRAWLSYHSPKMLEHNLLLQLFWQRFILPLELRDKNCDILFTSDAGSVCCFQPNVALSQDLLPFEHGIRSKLPIGYARLRLFALGMAQRKTIANAKGAIFLTEYARNLIGEELTSLKNSVVIPHGVDEIFKDHTLKREYSTSLDNEGVIDCIYVSNLDFYKNQDSVVEAFGMLLRTGVRASLTLIGGGAGRDLNRLRTKIAEIDPLNEHIKYAGHLNRQDLVERMLKADIFIFASSCETLPITLLEAMSLGLPITSSVRGPMPEIVGKRVPLFDPEEPEEIFTALKKLSGDHVLRNSIGRHVKARSSKYCWAKCADTTFQFIAECYARWK